MSSLSQFTGGRKIASIVNAFSSGNNSRTLMATFGGGTVAKGYTSGALTANTLATILSVTGRGSINFASAYSADATTRTIRLKITIDGVSVFDATTNSISTNATGLVGIGGVIDSSTNYTMPIFQPVRFYSSCLVQIASSLSETNKITTDINYETDA